jgi:hypothetical protein
MYLLINNMSDNIVLLEFARQSGNEPEIEAQTTVGYLTKIQKQLERTSEWGTPCVSLEISRRPKMVGRIGAHVTGDDYDKITGGLLGPNYTSPGEEEIVKVRIRLNQKQMAQLATINDFDTGKGPYRWTTSLSEEIADRTIEEINEVKHIRD